MLEPRIPLRSVVRSLLTLALLAPVAGAQAQVPAPTPHPYLWRIEDRAAGGESWLFGTMHLGDDRLVDLPAVVDKARAAADALYCELALDQAMRNQVKLVRLMMAPKGQTLDKVLPADLYARLDRRMHKLGASVDRVKAMRVWAAGLVLAQLEAARLGMTRSLDQKLYTDAKRDDKEVGGLETVEEQMQALGGGTTADYIASLRNALDQHDKFEAQGRSSLGALLELYLTGDENRLLDYIESVAVADVEVNDRLMKPMLQDRNGRMADRIAALLKEHPDKGYFFAIGVLHFIGDQNILALLRAKGLRITRVQPPRASWAEQTRLRTEISNLRKQVKRLRKQLAKERK